VNEITLLATDLEVGAAQPLRSGGGEGRGGDAAGEEALRDRAGAARDGRQAGDEKSGQSGCVGRALRLAHADAAARRLSVLPESGGGTVRPSRPIGLREMVAKTQFAITGEDTRYYLNGALFVLRPTR
jgi:hypothetical protein